MTLHTEYPDQCQQKHDSLKRPNKLIEALEDLKNFVFILRVKANAIVANNKMAISNIG